MIGVIKVSNWHKVKHLNGKVRGIIANKERASNNSSISNSGLRYGTDIFLKFGNSDTNIHNAVKTIEIYKEFTNEYDEVWISTDSLSNGMSPKRIAEFNSAISSGKRVDLYMIAGKTSGGNNEISHKARIIEIQGDKQRMTTPDPSLTPNDWVNGPKLIWIKVGKIRNSHKKSNQFIVQSSQKLLSDSISKSQYNFGYIEEL